MTSQQTDQEISNKIEIEWNIREIFETILRTNDALVGRNGVPIPLSPEEVAGLLRLKHFIDKSLNHALRRCVCNKVYCRLPDKMKPCIFDPEELILDKSIVYTCKWRGKRL